MPKRKTTRPKSAPAKAGELREEVQLRRLMARLQIQQAKAMLATYGAADRGRRNKDWRASPASADLAIIPDAATLNARARQAVRDTWIGASMRRSARRNVVGTGIDVVPLAKDAAGNPLVELNRASRDLFWRWASNKQYCDRERRQNFWQKQRLCVNERYTVGESIVVWSYVPSLTANGTLDRSKPVGLRLQSFEPEQFNTTVQSYEGREVRGGVELDPESNAAVAYHFYQKNPNDYLGFSQKSVRVEAERVFHYYDQERVLQTRGVTAFSPVLQDIRDFDSFRQATLWRQRMEACVGAIVKQVTPNAGFSPLGVAAASGDTRTTASGMSELDFVPGMVPHLAPGEDIVPYTPPSAGNTYEPFTTVSLRGIGAGVGMSYDQVSRHSDANYSAARQNMLEDGREWDIEQEDLISDVILPVYELFFRLALLEGRFDAIIQFDADDFARDPMRYTDAACIAPARPWIDPEKEANAYAKMIDYRLVTREEILTSRGKRYAEVMAAIGEERKTADAVGVTLPEDVTAAVDLADATQKQADAQSKLNPAPTANGPDPELERIKAEADAYGVAVRAGVLTPQKPDEESFRQRMNLPPMAPEANAAWEKDEGTRRPITLAPPAGAPTPSPFGGGSAVADDTSDPHDDESAADLRARLAVLPSEVPNYRASAVAEARCDACRYFADGKCSAYAFAADPAAVCDAFETPRVTDGAGGKSQPPGPDGERPIDDPSGPFLDRGERGVQ